MSWLVGYLRRKQTMEKLHLSICLILYVQKLCLDEWKQNATINEHVTVHASDFSCKLNIWFSYPEFSSERKSLEPKCRDGHHLFVNARVKVCKDGLPGFGVNIEAWRFVAEHHPNILSKSLVIDLLDKQSNQFARRTFSEDAERMVSDNNYAEEATFCKLIRNWYKAEDDEEIKAKDRLSHRLEFRNYLLWKSDFSESPLYGRNVEGMHRLMNEWFSAFDWHPQSTLWHRTSDFAHKWKIL